MTADPRVGKRLLSLAVGCLWAVSALASGITDMGHELLGFSCANRFGVRELTLFGNGTLRLREDRDGQRSMKLAELTPDEVQAYLRRLRAENLREFEQTDRSVGPSGEWVQQCELRIDLGSDLLSRFRFSRMDSLSLDLARVVAIADELMVQLEERQRGTGFPAGYVPRPGDVLVRTDGSRYRILRFTADQRGLEVSGIDQPLLLYVATEGITAEFVGLIEREDGD